MRNEELEYSLNVASSDDEDRATEAHVLLSLETIGKDVIRLISSRNSLPCLGNVLYRITFRICVDATFMVDQLRAAEFIDGLNPYDVIIFCVVIWR